MPRFDKDRDMIWDALQTKYGFVRSRGNTSFPMAISGWCPGVKTIERVVEVHDSGNPLYLKDYIIIEDNNYHSI